MVLGVCRRVLDNDHDAEDAFQATFLVLVRRAGSIGRPELLANWLYGVAYRTAKKARTAIRRRRRHERLAGSVPRAAPVDAAWHEQQALLDEELQGLPDEYRAPLVLCYLEGKTHAEAARQLGCPPGSMSTRLARGRELLRERLEKRDRGRSRVPAAGVFALPPGQKAGDGTLPTPPGGPNSPGREVPHGRRARSRKLPACGRRSGSSPQAGSLRLRDQDPGLTSLPAQ
jgi:RNA polymerase sigma factor (sigma-70 family)